MQDSVDRKADAHDWFMRNVFGHRKALRRYIRGKGLSEADAEDVEQDVMVRAIRLENGDEVRNPKGLLYRIADNLLIDRFRRSDKFLIERVEDLDQLDVSDLCAAVDQIVIDRQRLRALGEAVDRLPPQARRVFIMMKLLNLSIKETARELGVSTKTVENHAVRAMKLCREYLRDRDHLWDDSAKRAGRAGED